jgi:hypothetical protein
VKVHFSGGMKECFNYFKNRNYYPQVVIRKERLAELRCLNLNGAVNLTITSFLNGAVNLTITSFLLEGEPSLVRRKQ